MLQQNVKKKKNKNNAEHDKDDQTNDENVDETKITASRSNQKFINNVNNIYKINKCMTKAIHDDEMKVNIKSITSCRKLVKAFDYKKFNYHTYQLKTERSNRCLIKGLNFSAKVGDIK